MKPHKFMTATYAPLVIFLLGYGPVRDAQGPQPRVSILVAVLGCGLGKLGSLAIGRQAGVYNLHDKNQCLD